MKADALVLGESLIDIVRDAAGGTVDHVGGSAANVAVALARLGRRVRFATSFAPDPRGRLIANHLAAADVALASDPGSVTRTSTAVATIGEDGTARYEFDLEWRLNPVEAGEPLVVHTCSLGAVLAPGADEVLALVARLRETATITYDINARPAITGRGPDLVARVEQMVALSDVVKASDEDLDALYPDVGHAEAARRLLALGPSAVVVTRGAAGSTWVGAVEIEVPALPVTVADTIGAGDTFGAALIDALWHRGLLGAGARGSLHHLAEVDAADLLGHAARAAAVTVSRPGANPPYRHELPTG